MVDPHHGRRRVRSALLYECGLVPLLTIAIAQRQTYNCYSCEYGLKFGPSYQLIYHVSEGLICDGLLVWRFSAICTRWDTSWRLYIPTAVSLANFCECSPRTTSQFCFMPYYMSGGSNPPPIISISRRGLLSQNPVTVYADHGILGMEHANYAHCAYGGHIPAYNVRACPAFRELDSILNSLCCRNCRTSDTELVRNSRQYLCILRAIMESCAITWIGLFIYNLMSLMPHGEIITVRHHFMTVSRTR